MPASNRWMIQTLVALCMLADLPAIQITHAATASMPSSAAPKAGEIIHDCSDCPDVVVIPAGSFIMGSSAAERTHEGVPEIFGNREQPQHQVTIARPFGMGRTEVTVKQFAQFVSDTKRSIPDDCIGFDREKDSWTLKKGSWRDPGFKQVDNEPVVCISQKDALAYAAWLAKKTGKPYRLASEAEWEYAARGGTTTARYWGDAARTLCENANVMSSATLTELGWPESWQDKLICAGRHAWTTSVGSFEANPFGLSDMYGSVWEWIADCAHDNYVGAPTDGSAWMTPNCDKFMVRGGAFHSEFWLARSATRSAGLSPDGRPIASGFRVVRDLP